MRHYKVTNTKGNFIREEDKEDSTTTATNTPADSTVNVKRSPAKPVLPKINR